MADIRPFTLNFQNVFPKNKGLFIHSHGAARTIQNSESDAVRAQLPLYDPFPSPGSRLTFAFPL